MQKPLPQHWTNIAMGKSGFLLVMSINSQKKVITVSFEINTDDAGKNKEYFDYLKDHFEKDAATNISDKVDWARMDGKKVSLVTLSENYDFMDSATHPAQFAWFLDTVKKFMKFFRPKIKSL